MTQKNIEARVLFIDFEFDNTEEGTHILYEPQLRHFH